MAPSSSPVLSFVMGLCGLTHTQRFKVEQTVWVLGQKHPERADDAVQAMALRAWTNHLFSRGTNTGDLIAAANRAVNERS